MTIMMRHFGLAVTNTCYTRPPSSRIMTLTTSTDPCFRRHSSSTVTTSGYNTVKQQHQQQQQYRYLYLSTMNYHRYCTATTTITSSRERSRSITTNTLQNNNVPPNEPKRLFLWVPTSTIIEQGDSHSNASAATHDTKITAKQQQIIMDSVQNHRPLVTTTLQQNILLPTSALLELASNDTHSMNIVQSVDDIVEAVNQHYSTETTTNNNKNSPKRIGKKSIILGNL